MESQIIKLLNLSKLEPIDGTNYRRWSQKLLIVFEQLKVDYVLNKDPSAAPLKALRLANNDSQPTLEETATVAELTAKATVEIEKYEHDNKTVRGILLSHMSNALFDFFLTNKSVKFIWETLEKKYGSDDAGKKKYVAGEFLRFQMADDKPVMEHVHEYKILVADILAEGMEMCEFLQANFLIEKLPDSWATYRNHLKHKKKNLTLEELVGHLKIEEVNRLKDIGC